MRSLLLHLCLIAPLLLSAAFAGEGKVRYQCQIFRLNGEFAIGENTLKIGRKGCFWNDFKLTFEEGFEAKLPEDQIKMIHSPNILKKEGELARVTVEARQPFQYMAPKGELFELKETVLPVGMDIEIKANTEEENVFLISDLKLELRTVNRREKAEGTHLPVGKPVLDVASYSLKLKVREHKNYGILIRPKGTQGAIIIRMEVDDR